jgi:hypothetical protein
MRLRDPDRWTTAHHEVSRQAELRDTSDDDGFVEDARYVLPAQNVDRNYGARAPA